MEDILDHRGKSGPMCECLVRWKDFDVSHDSWVRCKLLTPLALQTYEQLLTEHARFCEGHVKNSKIPSLDQNLRLARVYLSSFTGHGRYSVLKDFNSLSSSATNFPIAQLRRRPMLRLTLPLREKRLLLFLHLQEGSFVDPHSTEIQDVNT